MIPRIRLSQGSRPFLDFAWRVVFDILVACLLFPFLARSLMRVLVVDWLVGWWISFQCCWWCTSTIIGSRFFRVMDDFRPLQRVILSFFNKSYKHKTTAIDQKVRPIS
jgi:hypothetical protein